MRSRNITNIITIVNIPCAGRELESEVLQNICVLMDSCGLLEFYTAELLLQAGQSVSQRE